MMSRTFDCSSKVQNSSRLKTRCKDLVDIGLIDKDNEDEVVKDSVMYFPAETTQKIMDLQKLLEFTTGERELYQESIRGNPFLILEDLTINFFVKHGFERISDANTIRNVISSKLTSKI
jgi:hypothetical protein